MLLQPVIQMHETGDDAVLCKLLELSVVTKFLQRFGLLDYVEHLLPYAVAACAKETRRGRVAAASLHWLVRTLGVGVAARHIVRPLLRLLAGDTNAGCAVETLAKIAVHHGESVVAQTYLPHVYTELDRHTARISARTGAVLLNLLRLLKACIEAGSRAAVEQALEALSSQVFEPLFMAVSSTGDLFTLPQRRAVCKQTVVLLLAASKALGREVAQQRMGPLVQQFFSFFDIAHPAQEGPRARGASDNEGAAGVDGPEARPLSPPADLDVDKLGQVFGADMASFAYTGFCQLLGQITMQRTLANSALIERLAYGFDEEQAAAAAESSCDSARGATAANSPSGGAPGPTSGAASSPHLPATASGAGAASAGSTAADSTGGTTFTDGGAAAAAAACADGAPEVGSQDTDAAGGERSPTPDLTIEYERMELDSVQSTPEDAGPVNQGLQRLQGDWQEFWAGHSAPGRRHQTYTYRDMRLQRFAGHTSAIKAVAVTDDETMLVSASKDKTVRLWQVTGRFQGDSKGMSCQRTYKRHRKGVVDVLYAYESASVVSCDGTVHVWDAETGYTRRQYDLSRSAALCLAYAPELNLVAAATTDSTIRCMDLRTPTAVHEWRTNATTAGVIRSMTVDPDHRWIGVGL